MLDARCWMRNAKWRMNDACWTPSLDFTCYTHALVAANRFWNSLTPPSPPLCPLNSNAIYKCLEYSGPVDFMRQCFFQSPLPNTSRVLWSTRGIPLLLLSPLWSLSFSLHSLLPPLSTTDPLLYLILYAENSACDWLVWFCMRRLKIQPHIFCCQPLSLHIDTLCTATVVRSQGKHIR